MVKQTIQQSKLTCFFAKSKTSTTTNTTKEQNQGDEMPQLDTVKYDDNDKRSSKKRSASLVFGTTQKRQHPSRSATTTTATTRTRTRKQMNPRVEKQQNRQPNKRAMLNCRSSSRLEPEETVSAATATPVPTVNEPHRISKHNVPNHAIASSAQQRSIPSFEGRIHGTGTGTAVTTATLWPISRWLDQRANFGMTPKIRMRSVIPPWKTTPWLGLETNNNMNHKNQSPPRLFQWDPDGVLFAVLDGQALRIYDWDSVVAADRQGRNRLARWRQEQRQRQGRTRADTETRQNSNDDNDRGTAGAAMRSKPGCYGIAPILSVLLKKICGPFNRLGPLSSSSVGGYLDLQWNPFPVDEIALLHSTGTVFIFDLGQIMAWKEDRASRFQGESSWPNTNESDIPPHQTIRLNSARMSTTTGSCTISQFGIIRFVSKMHLIASLDNQVTCHFILRDSSTTTTAATSRLIWKWTWPRQNQTCITSVVVVDSEKILVGSQSGTLVLLHWKKVQRCVAFQAQPSPTVLGEWSYWRTATTTFNKNITEKLACYPRQPGSMGVVNLSVHRPRIGWAHEHDHVGNQPARFVMISWHTACGWAFRAQLDLAIPDMVSVEILYTTPKICTITDSGANVVRTCCSNSLGCWSMPSKGSVVGSSFGNGTLLWSSVPPVTHILPPHDPKVLKTAAAEGDHHRTCTTTGFLHHQEPATAVPTLVQHDPVTGQVSSIALVSLSSSSDTSQPWVATSVAIHPLQEWMAVTTSNHEFFIYNARK